MILLIAKLRKQKNMSQVDLANILNVSQQSVSFYETGKREPPLDVLIKLSNYFGCTIDELVKGDSDAK